MKRLFPLTALVMLLGCAANAQQNEPRAHSNLGMKDLQSMCEMHKQMMTGKTPQEQESLIHERTKSMSPEMQQRLKTMRQQCK